jgi:3-hydroxyisobutyrate dehydrogenase-like beta-hydroxyacid dehydrogenase
MSAIQKVGIVGLGKMGAPMARHLLAKRFSVTGCDPAAQACANAKQWGVSVLG